MELNLTNKNIIITGGANGLCYDIAKAYYDAGGNICIMDIAQNISDSAKSIEKDRSVKFHQCDLSDIDNLDKEYSVVRDLCGGRIDVLFNGAGIQYREKAEDFPLSHACQWIRTYYQYGVDDFIFWQRNDSCVHCEQGCSCSAHKSAFQ